MAQMEAMETGHCHSWWMEAVKMWQGRGLRGWGVGGCSGGEAGAPCWTKGHELTCEKVCHFNTLITDLNHWSASREHGQKWNASQSPFSLMENDGFRFQIVLFILTETKLYSTWTESKTESLHETSPGVFKKTTLLKRPCFKWVNGAQR